MKNVIVKGALAAAALMLGTMACNQKPVEDRTAELSECKTDTKDLRTQLDAEKEKRSQLELQLAMLQSEMKQRDTEEARTGAQHRVQSAPRPTPVAEQPKAEEKKEEEVKKTPDKPATPEPGASRLRRK